MIITTGRVIVVALVVALAACSSTPGRSESSPPAGSSVAPPSPTASSMSTAPSPVATFAHAQFHGEVTYSSPSQSPWTVGDDGFLDFTDPARYWSDCELDPAPTDAAAFAQAVLANPNFESTEPVAARVGGVEALAMDVALSPAGHVCGPYRTDVHQWVNSLVPGKRLRLFLVDVPEGMSMRTLAITVMASEENYEEVIAEADLIIDSIEFHSD